MIDLYTIQPRYVRNILYHNGVYTCDHNHEGVFCYNEDQIIRAYDWYAKEMKRRIGNPCIENVKYPIWAWVNRPKASELTTMALKGHLCTLFHLRIERNRALLSNIHDWTAGPLNDYPLFDFDDESFDEKYEAYKQLSPEEQKKLKLTTWEQVFIAKDNDACTNEEFGVQATFWHMKIEDVMSCVDFVGDGYPEDEE